MLNTFAAHRRRGLTLVELMISVAVLSMIVTALGMMARAVEISSEYNQSYGTTTQNARVTMDRIDRAVSQAYSNSSWPGVWITEDVVGNYNFPDTLVVWRPSGTAANPQGAPLAGELTIFCPDPAAPSQFVELTVPGNTTPLPSASNATAFKTFIDGLKTTAGVNKVQLTSLLYSAGVTGSATAKSGVRFVATMNPSDADFQTYPGVAWNTLPWPQGLCSQTMGLRQVWVRVELQLLPAGTWIFTGTAAQTPVPYFGSFVYSYALQKW
ncbi:MAG TPA: prepilin-type N-terminal cleavage/methylation domain-containing protein [Pirellulales bacterium]|jgi:prepilin-type N-terminal cleavage/methylation domain-containing protein